MTTFFTLTLPVSAQCRIIIHEIRTTMLLHSKLVPVKMCGLAHAIEQAGLPWPGLPPYSNPAGESLMGIIPMG